MKILSVNAGSSSLKFQLNEMPEEKELINGYFEKVGLPGSFYSIKINGEKFRKEIDTPDHFFAVELLIKELFDNNIIESLDEIKGVGHRVVHGADKFNKTIIIDNSVEEVIEELSSIAPLHNPPALTGIRAFKKLMPNAVHTAVFDTAFHQTLPEEAYMYGVPYEWYTDYSVRKYGFHGTSHKYVSERINSILGRKDTKLIICHLGSGCSISAVLNGECIDTSMGFTPNAGLIMGTRCGDIDSSIISYIMNKTNMTTNEIDNTLNKKSGLLTISGVGSDNRDIEAAAIEGNKRCMLAQNMFARRVVEYIAKYYVLLGGADAICFTAGIGENGPLMRKKIIERLSVFGVELDEEANKPKGHEGLITNSNSKISCYVIPTNEEIMIARDTYDLVLVK